MSEQINKKCPFCSKYFDEFSVTYSGDGEDHLLRNIEADCYRCAAYIRLRRLCSDNDFKKGEDPDPFIQRWNWLTEPSDVVKEEDGKQI